LGLSVYECHRRASNELDGSAVDDVVDEGLAVTGDEDRNGTVDALWDNTLAEWHGDRGRLTAQHHLAE